MSQEIDTLIAYLETEITLEPVDLTKPESERYTLFGMYKMLDWVKDISEKGYPEHDNNS